MTDEDFLSRIRRLQAARKPTLKEQRASVLNGHKHKADPERSKAKPNMVVGIRIDPARITLPKLRFMGEVPVHQHLLQDDREA